ncbi:hypothetical protein [Leptothrix discophora]|uniref:Uncharacterized protein n=1 Tax=Leptothrix discophora TaxID=89 RepID=A0ABT9FZ11_LEPDI|nr:hypothetical protein [Leptothrix discophora]MDP4299381.1 hypothetical protein [Leptothrix discophora]
MPATPPPIGSAHRRRLRLLWQSAGWPCHDRVEAELLAAGLVQRVLDEQGRMTLHLSDAGVQELVRASEQNRRARSAHDGLVSRVAATLAREGRLAWCGLSVRAPLAVEAHPVGPTEDLLAALAEPALDAPDAPAASPASNRWALVLPDVYSIRQTSAAAWLQPQVHEIKVSRADLLADLRLVDKRAAYLALAGALYYVLAEGIGDADDVPPACGVLLARGSPREHAEAAGQPVLLEVQRLAPTRPLDLPGGLPFGVWMALARKAPQAQPDEGQLGL